jgi:hypothetical protein
MGQHWTTASRVMPVCRWVRARRGGSEGRRGMHASWVMRAGGRWACWACCQLGPKGSDRGFRLHPSEVSLLVLLWLAGSLFLWVFGSIRICVSVLCFYSLSTASKSNSAEGHERTVSLLYFESTRTFIRFFLFSLRNGLRLSLLSRKHAN